MRRERGELVPIGEVIADLSGPVQALRETPPPARRGFTLADQVNQLVSASEADADLGFMARTMALCSLPRSNPGNRKEYKRVNGPFTLYMVAGGGNKLPYGNLPRLLLAWVCSEAVRTRSRVLILGKSLSEFMRALGIYSSHGRTQTRLRNQMDRLFHASVELNYEDKHGKQFIASRVVDRGEFWWNERKPDQPSLWDSEIRLGEDFFNEIISHPVPIDMNTLAALKRSPLGLDLYLWLVYRTFSLRAPQRLTWQQLYGQFGARRPAHSVSWSSPRIAPGATEGEPGCFRWRRDDVPWQSRKPTSERTTQTRQVPSGASGGRCAGSSSRASNWTTPIRRARNASSPARRPVNAPRSDERGPGPFSLPAKPRSGLERF